MLNSEVQGYSTTKFILACLRTRFLKKLQLGQKELDALTRSNAGLLAIGRNLNQIAKVLNTVTIDHPQYSLQTIGAVRVDVKEHVRLVAKVIATSTERWNLKPYVSGA
jgi:hypothetical protein